MTSTRNARTIATVGALALLAGAFLATPAEAGKKKKKAPPAPAACAPYASPEWATGAETSIVTDAATADAPIEVELATEPGLGTTSTDDPSGGDGAASHTFHTVQIDSAAPTATLHVRAEYLEAWDYDLHLRPADMVAVAYEGDFNPATAAGPTPIGSYEGGHAEPGISELTGYTAKDCDGFTIDVGGGITAGGAVTLKVWLGE